MKNIFKLLIVLFCFITIQYSGECSNYNVVRSGADKGIADDKGNIILSPEYNTIEYLYYGDLYKVCRYYNQKCGIYDASSQRFIVPTLYSYIQKTSGGFIVKNTNKYGFFDKAGFPKLGMTYNSIEEYSSGLKLEQSGLYGYADSNGDILLDCQYNYLFGHRNGLIVKLNSFYGVYSRYDGSEIIPIKYSLITSDGIGFTLKLNEKYGYANSSGRIVADIIYDSVNRENDVLIVEQASGLGVLTDDGMAVLDCIYDIIILSQTGYIIQQNGKKGFANLQGTVVLPCIYDEIKEKTNTYAKVIDKLIGYDLKQGNLMGFADVNGNIIFPCEYNYIEPKYNFPWFWKKDIKVSYYVIKNYKKSEIMGIMDKNTKTVTLLNKAAK